MFRIALEELIIQYYHQTILLTVCGMQATEHLTSLETEAEK